MLMFTCPGCGVNKKYRQFFAHVAECDKITEEMKTSQNQMKQKVAANQVAVPKIPHLYSTMSQVIFVFDKDSKQVLMFNRTDGQVTKAQIDYRQSEGNFQVSLPHNFQVAQVGKDPKVYMIGGGDYNLTPKSMYETR